MNTVRTLVSQIKRLRPDEIRDLVRQLKGTPGWPSCASAPVDTNISPTFQEREACQSQDALK